MVHRSTSKWLDPTAVKRSGEVEGDERRRQDPQVPSGLS